MTPPIISHSAPVLLIGGGPVSKADMVLARTLTSKVVAVDGGALWAHQNDMAIDALVGDMDSVTPDILAGIPSHLCHPVEEQTTTDFDKALRHVSAPLIIAIGFSGGRMDHQLAVLHSLLVHPDRACLVLGEEDLAFLAPKALTLPLDPGTRVSLFPMGPVAGTSTGLRWPIDGLTFDPVQRIGTSNAALGEITLRMEAPQMLCLLPRAFIQPVAQALAQMPPALRWSARAE